MRRTREIPSGKGYGGQTTLSASSGGRLQQWKQNHIADRRLIRKQHRYPIDSEALPGGGWHSVLERPNVIVVVVHRFQPAAFFCLQLREESLLLVQGIVDLRKPIGQLSTGDKQSESTGAFWVRGVP